MIGAAKVMFKQSASSTPTGGKLFAMGLNVSGECAQGSVNNGYSSPIQVGSLTDWTAVAGGAQCAGAIRAGKLFTWGRGANGRTGHSDTTDYSSPVQVGAATDWTAISGGTPATGTAFMHGIRGGKLFAWGANNIGQLGDGTRTERPSPVQIGAATDWTSVSCAQGATENVIALRAGGIFVWGDNSWYQLATGNDIPRSSPVQVGAETDWDVVSAGETCFFGIRGGRLFAWGYNYLGRLGTGNGTNYSSPVQIGAAADWTHVVGMGNATLGIRGGRLFTWGSNQNGCLGDGTTTARSSPVPIGAGTDWTAIGGSNLTAHGVRGGVLFGWGGNATGAVGDGSRTNLSSPVPIGAETDWKSAGGGLYRDTGQPYSFAIR